ncbi:hypothetical protein ATANTOWER_010272 [Ataeniobius toweri]|uniref:Uncharacterized protein n=1 Tax=Ataeniobius toweri TaxID=208326 RepID=A0ABU7AQ80_9TELE|nr:hypothetical protein [Ataeniobius toweri]
MKESHKKPSLQIATSCVKGIANERKGIANEKKVKLLQKYFIQQKTNTAHDPKHTMLVAASCFENIFITRVRTAGKRNVKTDEAKCRAVLEESLLRLQNTSYTSCTMHVPLFRLLLFPLNSHMLL